MRTAPCLERVPLLISYEFSPARFAALVFQCNLPRHPDAPQNLQTLPRRCCPAAALPADRLRLSVTIAPHFSPLRTARLMEFTIRAYTADDLPAMKEITVEAFDGVSLDRNLENKFGVVHGHDWRWRKSRHLDEDAARHPKGIFVAEASGRVAGYVTSWVDAEAGIGNIPNLAVDRRYRGHGVGRRLLEHVLDYFRELGLSHARIETLVQNPVGQSLYPSLGFEEIGRQIHYCRKL